MEDENLKDEILEDENLKDENLKDEILKDESWKDENLKMILSIEKLDRYGRVTEYIPEPTEPTLSKGNRMTDCMKTERPTSEYSKGGPSSRGSRISGRLRVTMQDGESFTISERQALRLGLESGAGMTQDVYEEILSDLRSSCMRRCGALLGNRDYTVKRLRTKLGEAGFPPLICAQPFERQKQAEDHAGFNGTRNSRICDRRSFCGGRGGDRSGRGTVQTDPVSVEKKRF